MATYLELKLRCRNPEGWDIGLRELVLGSLILYLKGMRRMMIQLSGFYYILYYIEPLKEAYNYGLLTLTSTPLQEPSILGGSWQLRYRNPVYLAVHG